MSIKVLNEETVEYNIYAVRSTPDEAIELNDDCRFASGFNDKSTAIGYAICVAENFNYTDIFITEVKTINNYWSTEDAVKQEKIVWSCMKFDNNEESENDSEFEDDEITDETDELVDSDE